jgi:hypothetical protein
MAWREVSAGGYPVSGDVHGRAYEVENGITVRELLDWLAASAWAAVVSHRLPGSGGYQRRGSR